jgi:hypothetical protein
MDPVDDRITAAQLMALRDDATAHQKIADVLGVRNMAPNLAARSLRDIAEFVETGDATLAAQLIHAAIVRQSRSAG